MGRKSDKKIFAGKKAMFLSGNKLITGSVSNLSRNRMLINSQLEFPLEIKEYFNVLIIYKNKNLLVPVKIRKFIKIGNYYEAISVEVINTSNEYQELVKEQNSYSRSFSYFRKKHTGNNASTLC